MLEMQRIIVKCFWQYLSLSTHDTYVILYEIKVFYLVLDNLFSFFSPHFPSPSTYKKENLTPKASNFFFYSQARGGKNVKLCPSHVLPIYMLWLK